MADPKLGMRPQVTQSSSNQPRQQPPVAQASWGASPTSWFREPTPYAGTVGQEPAPTPAPQRQPGAMEQYWNQVQGQMAPQNRPTNYAQEAYHRSFGGPNTGPNYGQYFDRQYDKASGRIDDAMAARGMYGSGAAIQAQQELASDMAAAQAGREADYNMRWNQAMMQGATGVDQLGLQQSADDRAWKLAGGSLASQAQQAQRLGDQDMLGNLLNQAQMGMGVTQDTYNAIMQSDPALFQEIQTLALAGRNQEAAAKANEWQRRWDTAASGAQLYAGGIPSKPGGA